MKKIVVLIAILSSFAAVAQTAYDLSPRGVEPARTRIYPYSSILLASEGSLAQSRYIIPLAEFTESTAGTSTTYAAHFAKDVSWLNRQVILRVGYVDAAYTLYVNGREMGFAPAGVMGVEFNVTKATKEGKNDVNIVVERSHPANKLYTASKVGLKDVVVFSPSTLRIRDIGTKVTLNESGDAATEFIVPIKCDALNPKSARVHFVLRNTDGSVLAEEYREITLDMRREDTLRFACLLPKSVLWSAAHPTQLRVELESRMANRVVECVSRKVGVRQINLQGGALSINGEKVALKAVEYSAISSLDELAAKGFNTIIITYESGMESVLDECAKRGIYVIVRTPIDTTSLGDHIRKGGNPSNDPLWCESYLWCNAHSLYSTISNPAVVGFAIAKGKTSGINIYESYIMLKHISPHHFVIYEGARGEWACDTL